MAHIYKVSPAILYCSVGWLRFQGAHVVQSVADFDENHSDVIAHGEQQLLEVFCLCRSLDSKDATTDFCESHLTICATLAPKMLEMSSTV